MLFFRLTIVIITIHHVTHVSAEAARLNRAHHKNQWPRTKSGGFVLRLEITRKICKLT